MYMSAEDSRTPVADGEEQSTAEDRAAMAAKRKKPGTRTDEPSSPLLPPAGQLESAPPPPTTAGETASKDAPDPRFARLAQLAADHVRTGVLDGPAWEEEVRRLSANLPDEAARAYVARNLDRILTGEQSSSQSLDAGIKTDDTPGLVPPPDKNGGLPFDPTKFALPPLDDEGEDDEPRPADLTANEAGIPPEGAPVPAFELPDDLPPPIPGYKPDRPAGGPPPTGVLTDEQSDQALGISRGDEPITDQEYAAALRLLTNTATVGEDALRTQLEHTFGEEKAAAIIERVTTEGKASLLNPPSIYDEPPPPLLGDLVRAGNPAEEPQFPPFSVGLPELLRVDNTTADNAALGVPLTADQLKEQAAAGKGADTSRDIGANSPIHVDAGTSPVEAGGASTDDEPAPLGFPPPPREAHPSGGVGLPAHLLQEVGVSRPSGKDRGTDAPPPGTSDAPIEPADRPEREALSPMDETLRRIREGETYDATTIMKYLTPYLLSEQIPTQQAIFDALRERINRTHEADEDLEGQALQDLRHLAEDLVDNGMKLEIGVLDADIRAGMNGDRLESISNIVDDLNGSLEYRNLNKERHGKTRKIWWKKKKELRQLVEEDEKTYAKRTQMLAEKLDPTNFGVAMYALLSPEKKREMITPSYINFLGMPHEDELAELYESDSAELDIQHVAHEMVHPSEHTSHEVTLAHTAIYHRLQYLLLASPEQVLPYLAAVAESLQAAGLDFQMVSAGQQKRYERMRRALSVVETEPEVVARGLRWDTEAENGFVRWRDGNRLGMLFYEALEPTSAQTADTQPEEHIRQEGSRPSSVIQSAPEAQATPSTEQATTGEINENADQATREDLDYFNEQLDSYLNQFNGDNHMQAALQEALEVFSPNSEVISFGTNPEDGPHLEIKIANPDGTFDKPDFYQYNGQSFEVDEHGVIPDSDVLPIILLGRAFTDELEEIRTNPTPNPVREVAFARTLQQYLNIKDTNSALLQYTDTQKKEFEAFITEVLG